jgi:hypothetical protein
VQVESLKGLIQHIGIPQTNFAFTATSDNLLLGAEIINGVNGIGMPSTLQSAFEERRLFGSAVPKNYLARVQASDDHVGVQSRNGAGGDGGVASQRVFDFSC